jgi:hypothetical protein
LDGKEKRKGISKLINCIVFVLNDIKNPPEESGGFLLTLKTTNMKSVE